MSETTKCKTGCVTPSVCSEFYCNAMHGGVQLPSVTCATPAPEAWERAEAPLPITSDQVRALSHLVETLPASQEATDLSLALSHLGTWIETGRQYPRALLATPQVAPERPFAEHACLTGDCPHETQSECDAALASEYRRLAVPALATPAPETRERDALLWRTLEESAKAVRQGDADESAVRKWLSDNLGVDLFAAPHAEARAALRAAAGGGA